ncbi:hypothetical protein SAMN05660463_00860 [Pseudomonas sp. URIL14HWK12:I9]|nr:hypothetical protein F474_00544 [Pseudomonas sp. URIL14HWK12:I12]PVZ27019.1 hypothetical protein F470_00199 [Pseudomonas sp. URIL14HWK12:I10]PVZ37908.1 hypothetical protein F472_00544 [Pseudomonas sp. URIL14HWK12:I11]SNZ05187.1 hypothetical protein SAMN05660463_00860 [Pseudomonas sp. URIL14HWK12:I9]
MRPDFGHASSYRNRENLAVYTKLGFRRVRIHFLLFSIRHKHCALNRGELIERCYLDGFHRIDNVNVTLKRLSCYSEKIFGQYGRGKHNQAPNCVYMLNQSSRPFKKAVYYLASFRMVKVSRALILHDLHENIGVNYDFHPSP